jgi:hypothetical protein
MFLFVFGMYQVLAHRLWLRPIFDRDHFLPHWWRMVGISLLFSTPWLARVYRELRSANREDGKLGNEPSA